MPYDHSSVEPKWQARWRDAGLHKTPDRPAEAQVLRARHVPLPVGRRPARRALRGLHRDRRHHPLEADAGVPGAAPDGLGRLRPAGGELRHQARRPPARDHRGGDRQLQAADRRGRVRLRLDARDRHHRSRVHEVDAVDLPPALPARPRLRGRHPDQLVPRRQDRPRQRRGEPGALRALRHGRSCARTCGSGCCGSPRYADRLLEDLDELDWPASTLAMQRNWIGRSEGAEVLFPSAAPVAGKEIRVFTTRPDTLYGATYMVLSPEHALVDELTTPAQRAAVDGVSGRGAPQERPRADRSGEGQDRRLHRRDGDQPGHRPADPDLDRRLRAGELRHRRHHGRAGARRARLRLRQASSRCRSFRSSRPPTATRARPGRRRSPTKAWPSTRARSTACRRPRPSGPSPAISRRAASARAPSATGCATGCSRASATGASRSRSSTAPPTASCRCPRSQLPVRLPDVETYAPTGTGESPLAGIEEWVATTCPKCGGPAKRETNTMPQWAGSCWYYLRYLDPKNDARAFDPALRKGVDGRRPLRRRRRARRPAPALRALLAQGALRHGPRAHQGAVPEAAPPGDGARVLVPGQPRALPRARPRSSCAATSRSSRRPARR